MTVTLIVLYSLKPQSFRSVFCLLTTCTFSRVINWFFFFSLMKSESLWLNLGCPAGGRPADVICETHSSSDYFQSQAKPNQADSPPNQPRRTNSGVKSAYAYLTPNPSLQRSYVPHRRLCPLRSPWGDPVWLTRRFSIQLPTFFFFFRWNLIDLL